MPEPKPLKPEKGSVLKKKDEKVIEPPDYSDEEKEYIGNLQKRLEYSKTTRDQSHEEFDNLTYSQYYQANEDYANTIIKLAKNKGDIVYQSGTLRTKLFAFLSSFQGLNLKPDISAFNKQEIQLNVLGNAMEDIIDKTEELENDEEQKMLRQYELLKHGTVFVEELWEESWEVTKKISKGFYGEIKGVSWETKKALGMGSPRRRILSFLSVYLGDYRIYDNDDQPYQFTVKIINRNRAEQLYGTWERWKHVPKDIQSFSGASSEQMVSNLWRLTGDLKEGQVEVIKYQDKPNNEFQIILNGVLMLPMGYPLSEVSFDGGYTIVQQNLEPVRHDFAIGKSFIFKNKNLVVILDMMMSLGVLKTQKSYVPPYLNLSDRVISKTVFMPGEITRGLRAGQLIPVSDKEVQGMTNSEFDMIQELIKSIDASTSSQTFTGAREKGQVTATQIIELQRQARIMMGILVLAATLLEKKLTSKRLVILLKKWFSPLDKQMDEARKVLKNRYRIVSRQRVIENEGQGVRMTVLTEELPTTEQLEAVEDDLKGKIGMPVRILALNPKVIQSAKVTWVITINPKEKKSSDMNKLMFEAMIASAMNLGLVPNKELMVQRFAETWGEDPKLFTPSEEAAAPEEGQPASKSTAPKIKAPQVGIEGRQPSPATSGIR